MFTFRKLQNCVCVWGDVRVRTVDLTRFCVSSGEAWKTKVREQKSDVHSQQHWLLWTLITILKETQNNQKQMQKDQNSCKTT